VTAKAPPDPSPFICVLVTPEAASRLDQLPDCGTGTGFLWLDLTHEQFARQPEALRELVERLTGQRIFDLHLQDAAHLQHPSFFDSTSEYDMLIFRKLTPGADRTLLPLSVLDPPPSGRRAGHRLQEIITKPVTFFVFERLLVTVRNADSRTIEQVRARLLDVRARPMLKIGAQSELAQSRLPPRPEDLLLRLVSGMVDRYLELRQPLTERLDRWQRELFRDWQALLDARIELHRLQNLCEEQHDAIQEMRDAYLEATPEPQQSDAWLVRIADVIEHINRVLIHARRLENSIETAVQLHFSSTAHRTNQVVRTLTVITAIFAPLTLIAGLWGMNFEHLPLTARPDGFFIVLASMALLAVMLLLLFWVRRVLSDRPSSIARWWRKRAARRPVSGPAARDEAH
jgi:magnesium transporter